MDAPKGLMNIHPVAEIFPRMPAAEFEALKADIAAHGLREPAWAKDGAIIDGRHRWRACEELGVECPVREYEGADLVAFVVSLNLRRRHLDESQRAMVAASLANLGEGRPSATASIEAVSQTNAAQMLNVSRSAVQRAAAVFADGSPELVSAVQDGLVSVSAATEAAELDADTQRAIVEEVANGRKASEVIREYKPHVANNSGNNEWYTPAAFIGSARAVMGGIDLDPASSVIANRTVGAATFYTVAEDGLVQPWAGRVWMNPPYAQPHVADFCAKLVEELGNVSQACVLVNNGTETQWFQLLLAHCSAVCLLRGRVKFLDPEGNASGAPLQGQAVVYFGGSSAEFVAEFGKHGVVLIRG